MHCSITVVSELTRVEEEENQIQCSPLEILFEIQRFRIFRLLKFQKQMYMYISYGSVNPDS